MQLVLALVMLAILGGLLWSLWFTVTNPRRRARQIADQLSAPVDAQDTPFAVGYNRVANGALSVLFGAGLVVGVERASGPGVILILVLLFAPLAAACAVRALRGKPVLVISGAGIAVSRSRRTFRWADLESVAIRDAPGWAGIDQYDLELHLAVGVEQSPARRFLRIITIEEGNPVTVPLVFMSPGWPQIARAIHERSGRAPIVPSRFTQAAN